MLQHFVLLFVNKYIVNIYWNYLYSRIILIATVRPLNKTVMNPRMVVVDTSLQADFQHSQFSSAVNIFSSTLKYAVNFH